MVKAIIFDGGGTIWDSMEILYDSYKWAFGQLELCREKDFPFSIEDCNRLSSLKDFNTEVGKAKGFAALFILKTKPEEIFASEDSNGKLLSAIKKLESDKNFLEVSEKLGDLFTKYLYEIFDDTKYPLCESVGETLKNLKEKGFKLAMVSNRRRNSTLNILKSHGIDSLFDRIITWEDQTKPKPSPEGVEKVLDKLALKRNDAIFVGDSSVDILSGRAAGLKTVGVLSGMADENILRNSGADFIVNDLSELLNLDLEKL